MGGNRAHRRGGGVVAAHKSTIMKRSETMMNNMNEKMPLTQRIKSKAAELVSDVLIQQADQGVKFSTLYAWSEAQVPVELLKEDAE